MAQSRNKSPKPKDLLFENLFGEGQRQRSFDLIAEGLSASRCNAERLFSDVRVLIEAGRLSSARFLLTTAREEIAKSYILADMCRVDRDRHKDVLRKLCGAFYDHIFKHAYLVMANYQDVRSMDQVKTIWESEVRRWWPGDLEDGMPDMPHDTYFNREFPLYIDYSDYEGRWLIPADSDQCIYFDGMGWSENTPITGTERLIGLWRNADAIGICSPTALEILNSVFRTRYVREGFMREDVDSLNREVAQRTDVSLVSFMASPLAQWPLYHLVKEF